MNEVPFAAYAAPALFALHALITLAGAFAAVTSLNMARALAAFLASMFGLAGVFLLMNAAFLALAQLLVYVGAVGVLLFFALSLSRGQAKALPGPKGVLFAALGATLPALAAAACAFAVSGQAQARPRDLPVADLGAFLLTGYALPFEIISVALFAAMAGAVTLGFTRRRSA